MIRAFREIIDSGNGWGYEVSTSEIGLITVSYWETKTEEESNEEVKIFNDPVEFMYSEDMIDLATILLVKAKEMPRRNA